MYDKHFFFFSTVNPYHPEKGTERMFEISSENMINQQITQRSCEKTMYTCWFCSGSSSVIDGWLMVCCSSRSSSIKPWWESPVDTACLLKGIKLCFHWLKSRHYTSQWNLCLLSQTLNHWLISRVTQWFIIFFTSGQWLKGNQWNKSANC